MILCVLLDLVGFIQRKVTHVITCIVCTVVQGIITAPILFAMEEFPQLRAVVDQGFENPANVDIVSAQASLSVSTVCLRNCSMSIFYLF